jgi:hypothetical protein
MRLAQCLGHQQSAFNHQPTMSATAPSSGILATIASVFRQNRASCLALNIIAISLVVSYY